jgi:hypothetical protein
MGKDQAMARDRHYNCKLPEMVQIIGCNNGYSTEADLDQKPTFQLHDFEHEKLNRDYVKIRITSFDRKIGVSKLNAMQQFRCLQCFRDS